MQSSDTDSKNVKLNGDDDSINFRPSPNFIHMKKYLKSKFVEENSASNSTASDSESPSMNTEQQQKKEPENQDNSDVQPPLPPNPPSPEAPVVIKKEKEDVEEYSCNVETQEVKPNPLEQYNPTQQPQASTDDAKETGETMCRNYIRGTCERGSSCIYAHKLILSQLKYVYRFCINFQNRSGCNRPYCKFVHATVFEQEYFYKTGFLPPHTMAHLKQENPAPAPVEDVQPETSGAFLHQQPPQVQPAVMEQPKLMENSTATPINSNILSDLLTPTVNVKALKREWTDLVEGFEADVVEGMPVPKKCKECDITKIRLQFSKKMCEFFNLSLTDVKKKMTALNRKYAKLITLIISLLSQKSGAGSSLLNPIAGKESMLFDQLIRLMGSQKGMKLLHDNSDSLADETFMMRFMLAFREAHGKN